MTREGPSVRVRVDDAGRAVVALPETPSTGYRWSLRSGADVVVRSESWTPADDGRAVAGGGGVRRFELDVPPGPGPVDVDFGLARPWDPADVVETRRVVVDRD